MLVGPSRPLCFIGFPLFQPIGKHFPAPPQNPVSMHLRLLPLKILDDQKLLVQSIAGHVNTQ
jgi:hypothetical protein